MTTGSRNDPYGAFNFVVTILDASSELIAAMREIDKVAAGGFSECSGLESSIEVEEYKEGGNNGTVLKFPTRASTTPIQLKRGVGVDDQLWAWHNSFVMGRGQRRDGLIVLQNDDGQPVKVWAFHRGLPTRYRGPSFNATQSAAAIEELEITHEGLALISTSTSDLASVIGAVSAGVSAVAGLFD